MFQVTHEDYSDNNNIDNENFNNDDEFSEITDGLLSLDTLYHAFSIVRNQ